MALYSFLTGKIRVLEKNLLNQTDVDRMVDAPDFESAFKALNDTDYADDLLNVEPHEFKNALESDFQGVRDLLVQWIEEDELLEFMFLQYDAHNIKLYLKAKHSAVTDAEKVGEYTSTAGLTAPELIKKVIIEDAKETVLHATTEVLLQTASDSLSQEPTGFEIDSTVDLALFELLDERVGKVNSRIVRDLYRIQKETAWVKTFLRAKLLEKAAQEVKDVLPESFLRHYDLELEQAAEALPIDVRIKKAYLNYLESKKLWEFEKELEEAELAVIRDAKYATTGPEPAVGYFYAKNNAVRNLRLILTAKMNEIAAEEIKPRVRELY